MENFDGFLGAIAVSGMRAGLNKDTTLNLVVSLDVEGLQFNRRCDFSIKLTLSRLQKISVESQPVC